MKKSKIYKFFVYLFGKRKFKRRIAEYTEMLDKYYSRFCKHQDILIWYTSLEVKITEDLYFVCTPSVSLNRFWLDAIDRGFYAPKFFFSREDTYNGLYNKNLIPWREAYKRLINEDLLDTFEQKNEF